MPITRKVRGGTQVGTQSRGGGTQFKGEVHNVELQHVLNNYLPSNSEYHAACIKNEPPSNSKYHAHVLRMMTHVLRMILPLILNTRHVLRMNPLLILDTRSPCFGKFP